MATERAVVDMGTSHLEGLERFFSGSKAASHFDLASVDEATTLEAELEVFGLAAIAAPLAELSLESITDVDFVEDRELEAAGVRVVQRRKLRLARLCCAARVYTSDL